MANPRDCAPIPHGFLGTSPVIKIGLARNINNQIDFANKQNTVGRFDFVGPVFRGDVLSPLFLLRPIIRRAAVEQQPQRGGVVTEVRNFTPNASSLDRIANSIR